MHNTRTAHQIERIIGREALKPIVLFDREEVDGLFDAAPFALPPIVRTEWTLHSVLTVTSENLDDVRTLIGCLVDDLHRTFGFAVIGSEGPASFQIGVFVKPATKRVEKILTDAEFFEGADPTVPVLIG